MYYVCLDSVINHCHSSQLGRFRTYIKLRWNITRGLPNEIIVLPGECREHVNVVLSFTRLVLVPVFLCAFSYALLTSRCYCIHVYNYTFCIEL